MNTFNNYIITYSITVFTFQHVVMTTNRKCLWQPINPVCVGDDGVYVLLSIVLPVYFLSDHYSTLLYMCLHKSMHVCMHTNIHMVRIYLFFCL